MQRQHIESIYFLRIVAMLLVVLVHAISVYYTTFPMESVAFFNYHMLSRFVRIEAAIFIMLTGLVFFYNYYRKDLSATVFKDYYKKRILYILVPYLVWAVFYEYYAHIDIHRGLELKEVITRILTGQSYYQLHFIFLIVQFYLVFPLFMLLVKKSVFFRKYMWLIGIVLQLIYYYFNTKYHFVSFNLFLNLLGPYLVGGWIGVYYEEQKEKVYEKASTVFYGIIFVTFGIITAILHYYIFTLKTFYMERILYKIIEFTFLIAGSYFLFRMAERLQESVSRESMNIVKNIAVYSFGFYLLHPLVLNIVTKMIPLQLNEFYHLIVAAHFGITVVGCYFIIWLVHKYIPFAELIFGKLPKKPVLLLDIYRNKNMDSRTMTK